MTEEIVSKLLPKALPTSQEIEARYPARQLQENAMVTRIAPSPTGFLHIGGLYSALISERLAHQSGGIFYVRIEDTDKKREVAGATEMIVKSFEHYGIQIDEGETDSGKETGQFGPYKQSERAEIYQSFVKMLLEKGLAYVCFATPEELEQMRKTQEEQGIRPGYFGEWALWRDKTDEEVEKALAENKPYVIRFKSEGSFEKRINVKDLLLGSREFPENDQDIVILKSDGLPTYHMAHVIDDHLMGTTHVIRGNEWLSSLPLHLQLFATMGWQAPQYGHIAPIQKMDGTSKRKLSKRKDPEASIEFYEKEGYPEDSVIEYLLNLANSNFEDWRRQNPTEDNKKFALTFKKLAASSGPLFDFVKLNDVSKEVIAKYSAEKVFEKALAWANKYDEELATLMQNNAAYTTQIFNIERGDIKTARKDIAKWSDVKNEIAYFFDEHFALTKEQAQELLSGIAHEDIAKIVAAFEASYDEADTKEAWFAKVKTLAEQNGFAANMKEFKKAPENFKGNVADVAKVLRVLVTGRTQTPDLHAIMQAMGRERVMKRLHLFL